MPGAMATTGAVPYVEVGCVKDYPGSWAEYRIHEGGVVQAFRRISDPACLDWSERTRQMYDGGYGAYAFGRLADRCFTLTDRRARSPITRTSSPAARSSANSAAPGPDA